MKLQQYFAALGMTDAQAAMDIEKMSGQKVTRQLVSRALEGQPIAEVKAQALCAWLSKEFNRPITPKDISDLRTV